MKYARIKTWDELRRDCPEKLYLFNEEFFQINGGKRVSVEYGDTRIIPTKHRDVMYYDVLMDGIRMKLSSRAIKFIKSNIIINNDNFEI